MNSKQNHKFKARNYFCVDLLTHSFLKNHHKNKAMMLNTRQSTWHQQENNHAAVQTATSWQHHFLVLSVTTTITTQSAKQETCTGKNNKSDERQSHLNSAIWMLNVPRAQDKHAANSLPFSGGYTNEPQTLRWDKASWISEKTKQKNAAHLLEPRDTKELSNSGARVWEFPRRQTGNSENAKFCLHTAYNKTFSKGVYSLCIYF